MAKYVTYSVTRQQTIEKVMVHTKNTNTNTDRVNVLLN